MTPKFTSYHAKTIVIALLLFIDVPLLYSQSAGVPDSSFGKNGIVLTKVAAGRDDISESIAVTPDHKMVVAGNSNSVHAGSQNSIAVTQYLLNGKPDKTFNTTGTVIIMNAYAGAVAVQPDNKIVAGGIITNGSTSVFAVWRLNKNGTTDSVFGTGGYQKIPFFKGNATCYAVTLQPDGKILVGGNSAAYLAVARLKANGTPDAGFGTAGKFVQTVDTGSLVCRAIVVQPDGNIIIAGQYDSIYSRDETSSYMFALRLSSRGLPDASFGANGRREYRGASSNADYCYSAARLPESRIVIAGMSSVSSGAQPAGIVCVKSNGDVDASFGLNGWQYIDFGSTIYTGADAAVI